MAYPISDVTRRVVYSGSAGTGPYSFSFEVLTQTDVAVYKDTALLTLTTDYSVTVNANGTGSVTLVVAATGVNQITLVGDRAIERSTDFVTGGDLFANTLNEELDSVVIFAQQIEEVANRGLKAPVTDPTDVNMELPVKATRKGKVLAFDETTGDPVSGPALDSMITVIAQSANINTVADNISSVNTVAGNTSNINTVAGISGNVTTVAGISANVTTVADADADIATVAANIANVNTVAGVSANVTTVAGISANVTSVAGNATNINTVAGVSANVTTVAGISSDVTTVAAIDSDVTAVAADATDIGAVATSIANVNTVATNIANVNSVAGNTTNINAVAADATDIGTVSANIANVNTVAGISANVTTVAGIDTEVTALAGVQTEIEALYAEIGNIATKVSKTSDTGSAVLPAGSTAQRDGSPSAGYLRWNSDDTSAEVYDGSAWAAVGGGNSTTEGLYEMANTISVDYTIGTGNNAMSAGPITIDSGISVTVPTGSRWVIS